MERITNDFYPTPSKLTHSLLHNCSYINGNILEPCTGDDAITRILMTKKDTSVTATDIIMGMQYDATKLKYWETWDFNFDWVVTNPPFNQATAIIRHAKNYTSEGMAFLLRLSYLEPAQKINPRDDLLIELSDHMRQIIIFNPRPRFRQDAKRADNVTVAWMVWEWSWSWEKLGIPCPFIFDSHWQSYKKKS